MILLHGRRFAGERANLDQLIENAERLQAQQAAAAIERVKKRRGRKSMGAAERRQVAERMRRFEAFCVDTLPEERRAPFIAHMLACNSCHARFMNTHDFVQAKQRAVAQFRNRKHPSQQADV